MVTRQYNFTVGPETSTQPDVGTPASDDDLINRGYADARYAQGKSAAASIAAIKAIGTSDRRNGDLVIDVTTNVLYTFASASAATGDDDLVLTPDAGSGRWLKIGTNAGELIDLTDDVTGILPVSNGGSGGSTATAGFDNLAPTTTKGDIIASDGTNNVRQAIGADGLILKADSTTSTGLVWGSAAAGTGEVNYIENPDAEANTTGWATYADAAGSTPVDGTGGSPTVTWTRQNTVVLRGNQSFKLTKDGSNRQGEGVSYDFSIKEQDVSKKLKIQFDFKTNEDAAYASGDLTVYIYDVTNSTLITPVDTDIIDGQNIYQTSFNSTTSTSYRLIFHIATTNASAWDAYIDNVIVGPGMTSQGAVVGGGQNVDIDGTDFTNDAGLSIDGEITWKRVGSDIHITFSLETNGTGTDSGALTFDLATAIGQNITFVPGGYGTGYFGFFNSTNTDRFTLAARFIADGTGSLQFSQNEGTVGSGLPGTGFGAVNGDRAIVQISAILPVVEYQGSGIVPMLSEDNLSEWQTIPDSSISNLTTNIQAQGGKYQRVGDSIRVRASLEFSGSNTQSSLNPIIPNSLTVDTTKIFSSGLGTGGEDRVIIGFWHFRDASAAATYGGSVAYDVSAGILYLFANDGTNNVIDPAGNIPVTIADGDMFSWEYTIPIQEWAGSQNSLVGYSLANDVQSGLLNYYKTETLSMSAVITGTAKFTRIGNVVTVTGTAAWTWSAASSATSSEAVSSDFRPSAAVQVLSYVDSGQLVTVGINTNGTLYVSTVNSSFAAQSATSTGTAITFSYVIT